MMIQRAWVGLLLVIQHTILAISEWLQSKIDDSLSVLDEMERSEA